MKLFGNRRKPTHVARKENIEKKQINWKLICIIAACVVVVICGGVFAAYKLTAKPLETNASAVSNDVNSPTVYQKHIEIDAETGEEIEVETEIPASHVEGRYNILICGTDDAGTRTDTIIIAHLDTNTHEVALMSIPRDTPVSSGSGIMKINSVYGGGKEEGMERLESRLSSMLGFELDGYVLVDLDAFKETVDLVGGVTFDVPMNMHYSDPTQDLYINLSKGVQKLDGEKAMELVRFRKGYASQDIQRTKVQQDFLKALAKQCLSVSSLSKISEFAKIFQKNVITNLSVGNMVYLGGELLQCDFDEMKTYTVEGTGVMINGGSYYPLYSWSILEIVNESFNPYDVEITAANINVITPSVANSYNTDTDKSSTKELEAETVPLEDDEEQADTETPDESIDPSANGTDSLQTEPTQTQSAQTQPSQTQTTQPAETQPTQTEPAQTEPVVVTPAEQPTQTTPEPATNSPAAPVPD